MDIWRPPGAGIMDFKELRCFSVVYEENSINRAAGKLYISSQGLSRIIMKIESDLDAKLFVRTQKGVAPTECGELLYRSAQGILKQYDEMIQAIGQLALKESRLRIACAVGVLNAMSFDLLVLGP